MRKEEMRKEEKNKRKKQEHQHCNIQKDFSELIGRLMIIFSLLITSENYYHKQRQTINYRLIYKQNNIFL